jgi:hypothetical protein
MKPDIITGIRGAEDFYIHASSSTRIRNFNGKEGDRIKVIPTGPSSGTWGVIGTVDFSAMRIQVFAEPRVKTTLVLPQSNIDSAATTLGLVGVSRFDPNWIGIGTTPQR